MRRLALLGVLTACAAGGSDTDEFPVEPGTSPGQGTSPPGSEDGAGMLRGQVCVLEDLLDLRACAEDNRGGLTVRLGDSVAITDERGEFEMARPAGSLLAFTVSGPGTVTSTTPFSPSLTVPVVNADEWARTLASHQIFTSEGAGSVLGTVVRRGVPATGIEVASTPAGSFTPLFDGPAGFVPGATGARGVFFVPGVTAGSAGLTMRDLVSGGESTVAGVQIVNGGVTILDSVAIP